MSNGYRTMSKTETELKIDLKDVLSSAELESFQKQAKESGAGTLTEHAVNVFFGNKNNNKQAA